MEKTVNRELDTANRLYIDEYLKPECRVIELVYESLICNSGIGGSVTDPDNGEDAYWTEFIYE